MIKVNLLLTDYLTGKRKSTKEKLKAANSIKELLEQIDFRSEVVPENNLEMFLRLVASLKGKPLEAGEILLIEEIVNFKNNSVESNENNK
jgi:hypothetical protein